MVNFADIAKFRSSGGASPPSVMSIIHTAHGFDDHISLVGLVRIQNLQVNGLVESREGLRFRFLQHSANVTQ